MFVTHEKKRMNGLTDFQMAILREIERFPNRMASARDLYPYVAREKLTRTNGGAYVANIDRAAIKMPKYIVRLPPEDRWRSPTLCLTDAALDLLAATQKGD